MDMLMQHVYWAFGKKTYVTYEDFVAAVTDYNNIINPGGNG